jgi:hypothetical protein
VSCFNDLNNEIVWTESVSQARDMLQSWLPLRAVATIADDTRTLSLHVTARAGFGQSFEFQSHSDKPADNSSTELSYRDSLQVILENCILTWPWAAASSPSRGCHRSSKRSTASALLFTDK